MVLLGEAGSTVTTDLAAAAAPVMTLATGAAGAGAESAVSSFAAADTLTAAPGALKPVVNGLTGTGGQAACLRPCYV